jgi:hypothetical protein
MRSTSGWIDVLTLTENVVPLDESSRENEDRTPPTQVSRTAFILDSAEGVRGAGSLPDESRRRSESWPSPTRAGLDIGHAANAPLMLLSVAKGRRTVSWAEIDELKYV